MYAIVPKNRGKIDAIPWWKNTDGVSNMNGISEIKIAR